MAAPAAMARSSGPPTASYFPAWSRSSRRSPPRTEIRRTGCSSENAAEQRRGQFGSSCWPSCRPLLSTVGVGSSSACLEENELVDLVTGNLEAERAASAEAHIDSCAACRLVLIELARIFELRASGLPQEDVEDTEHPDDEVALPLVLQPSALVRGSLIGRYLVLGVLGAGAMGIVYEAYDPELDRKVALKLLRERKADRGRSERLLREARATAKLSHPNVVAVHDVGTHEGAVFMAIEFVDGGTLGEWQADGHGRDAIVSAYADAALGLAAAHAAGLVHRDFKPANVLVSKDGRVRVTDFGLARLPAEDLESTGADALADSLPSLELLTKTGAIVGTPAYMSPEQFEGAAADARSDQFSFCVALFEALCGERPFAGRTFSELSTNVASGRFTESTTFARLPRSLRAVLKRGLEVDPSQRFASMEHLLSSLSVGGSSWVPAVLGGSIALGLGVFGFSLGANQADASPCADEQESFSQIWEPPRKAALRERLSRSGYAYAEDVALRVDERIEEYSAQWQASFSAACALSAESAQTSCLHERARDLEQLLAALERGDSGVVEFAVQAVDRLTEPSSCVHGGEAGPVPAPTPPASLATQVEGFSKRLSLAAALQDTRQFEDALSEATAVRDEARDLGYTPTIAEAELKMGLAYGSLDRMEEAEAALASSAQGAWTSGHERVALEAAIELVFIAGVERDKPEAGEVWAEFGAASVMRMGGSARVNALLAEALGALAFHQRDYPESEEKLRRALELRESFLPPHHTLIATTLGRLSAAVLTQERSTEGLEIASRALTIHKAALGDEHPAVMRGHAHRGAALLQLGRLDEARTALDEALRVGVASLGAQSPRLVDVHASRASLASRQGRHLEAEVAYLEVLTALQSEEGEMHQAIPTILHNLGNVAFRAGKYPEATAYLERALEGRAALDGPEHPSSASSLATLSSVAAASGECEEAVGYAERALRLLSGPEVRSSRRAHVQGNYANALLCAGQEQRAVEEARAVVALVNADTDLERMRGDLHEILADAEFAVGNLAASEAAARVSLKQANGASSKASASYRVARASIGRDRDGALAMARKALEDVGPNDRADIEAFLEKH